jgi:hypothetical protein
VSEAIAFWSVRVGRSLNQIYDRGRKLSSGYRNTYMITDFKAPDFISNLPSISINQLDKAPASPAVWFALDKGKNVLYIGQAEKNLHNSLGSSQKKMQELQENNVSSIAYCLVEEKEVENLTKKMKRFLKPSIKQNKSQIFVPAINSLIKQITTKQTKKSINTKADFAPNFLREIEKTKQGANVSSLEEILLSDFTTKEIFQEFLKEIIRLWKFYKEYSNDEQQSQIDDYATLEEDVLAVLGDREEKKR